ncbi:RNA polymerase sigma factor [Reinekea sp. G2M2-21]|uniref:RNA polymerase sigma factor n=1 Tax=Reinekea sp. G2M2-21 TaxID=2788942 RepID=UPI0018AC49CF|nr:sigma-70 family RNA polymerase sigma factor [Reinekea sp. G2M2-21]
MDAPLDTQKALIALAKTGDSHAFERLVGPLTERMLSVAQGLAGQPGDADEIFQEAMLKAYRGLPRFRQDSQFSTWLYRIVLNTAHSHARKPTSILARLIAKSTLNDEFDVEQLGAAAEHSNPEQQLAQQQTSRAIQQAVQRLSKQERQAFVLCHQQDMKIQEAAQIMDCTDGAIKSYLSRSREKIRDQLQFLQVE